jgi:hypothetical protein
VIGLIGACFSAPVAAQDAASADQQWPRLPDGRPLVDVKGVKFALPSSGTELDDFCFWSREGWCKVSLRTAVEKPSVAREIFETQEQLVLQFRNIEDRPGAFLGAFNRSDYGGFGFGFGVGKNSDVGCQSWMPVYEGLRQELKKNPSKIASDGWAKFDFSKSPSYQIYVRENSEPDRPPHFDTFNCNWAGACSVMYCPRPDRRFSYQFSIKSFPREQWPSVISRGNAVLRFFWPADGEAKP